MYKVTIERTDGPTPFSMTASHDEFRRAIMYVMGTTIDDYEASAVLAEALFYSLENILDDSDPAMERLRNECSAYLKEEGVEGFQET